MKYAFFLIIIFISSCTCPECENISEPVRIIFLNDSGENLLALDEIRPLKALFCDNNQEIPFGIKDYVVSGNTEKHHLEFANEELHQYCLDEECCISIQFETRDVDTLHYQIDESSSKCCTSYFVSTFTYNGLDYLDKKEDTIGAYEIIID